MQKERSIVEIETQRRINVCVWAYAYECLSESLVSDEEFDRECYLIDLSIDTKSSEMDKWFRENFVPYTGQWVHRHPNKERLEEIAFKRMIYETRPELSN